MSIDLGAEFMKMALIKPGVPMEIVLNRESHRKTPFALTVRQQERFFGDEALKKVFSFNQIFLMFLFPLVNFNSKTHIHILPRLDWKEIH